MKIADTVGELLTPWWLQGKELNSNEAEELARWRQVAPTITDPVKPQLKEQPMAVNTVASRAVALVKKHGPDAVKAAERALAKVTNGKVTNLDDVTTYATDPRRLSVVARSMAGVGIDLGEAFPADLIGTDPALRAIRDSAMRLLANAQVRFETGSDQSLSQGADNIAADILRRRRVEAVLTTFGSETTYFLCVPNGGVPAEDFAWYKSVIQTNNRR